MKVGITGGIGSGKTSVCRVFETYHIPIFHADQQAQELYRLPEIIYWLKHNISADVIDSTNSVNKKKLASLVFSNANKLKQLEDYIHPIVRQKFDDWYIRQQNAPYVLYESAILFETGRFKSFDKTIVVTAPEKVRIERVMLRDRLTASEIRQRMTKQWIDERKIALADFVLENIEWPKTLQQIEHIHRILLSTTDQ
jgi:dephospho-CoA kinase